METVQAMRRAAFPIILIYTWIMMIMLGAIVLETFMLYPDIFRDPPRSLELATEFFSVRGPHTFFPPLGFLSWVTGAAALLLGWRVKAARWWILASLVMIVCDGLASILFFWPHNEIMFVEGSAVHSAEVLRQTAREFETLHWSRLAFNAASAASIFGGCLAFYRHDLLARLEARRSLSGSRPGFGTLDDGERRALADADTRAGSAS